MSTSSKVKYLPKDWRGHDAVLFLLFVAACHGRERSKYGQPLSTPPMTASNLELDRIIQITNDLMNIGSLRSLRSNDALDELEASLKRVQVFIIQNWDVKRRVLIEYNPSALLIAAQNYSKHELLHVLYFIMNVVEADGQPSNSQMLLVGMCGEVWGIGAMLGL